MTVAPDRAVAKPKPPRTATVVATENSGRVAKLADAPVLFPIDWIWLSPERSEAGVSGDNSSLLLKPRAPHSTMRRPKSASSLLDRTGRPDRLARARQIVAAESSGILAR